MSVHLKTAGAWQTGAPHIKADGAWKPVQRGWIKQGGTWVPFYQNRPNIGDAYQGGYYFGQMQFSDGVYDMIVSPKAQGDLSTTWLSGQEDDLLGATTQNDGRSNSTPREGNGAYPAASAAGALTIGGFTDWYVPALMEMDALIRALKPGTANNINFHNNTYMVPAGAVTTATNPGQTAVLPFRTSGAEALSETKYLTSSVNGTSVLYTYNVGTTSYNTDDNITATYRLRAIRRVKFS